MTTHTNTITINSTPATATAFPSPRGITRERAEEILQAKLPGLRADTVDVFKRMAAQAAQMQDRVAAAKALTFGWANPGNPGAGYAAAPGVTSSLGHLTTTVGDTALRTHANALQQAAGLADIPAAYVSTLLAADPELLTHNLNRRMHARGASRQLVRSVAGCARAVLSDKYRRLDSRPIIDALGKTAKEFGLVPVGGVASDLQFRLRLAVPQIFEPIPGEFVVLGLDWSNSDFGRGAHDIAGWIDRVVCANGAVTESALRQVHLGRRLTADGVLSEQTLSLDTQAAASAAQDVVRAYLDPARIEERLNAIRAANAKDVTPATVDTFLRKHLGKAGFEAAREVYRSAEVEMLPQGNSVWRLSNALSWLANKEEDADARADLQELAGKAMALAA